MPFSCKRECVGERGRDTCALLRCFKFLSFLLSLWKFLVETPREDLILPQKNEVDMSKTDFAYSYYL